MDAPDSTLMGLQGSLLGSGRVDSAPPQLHDLSCVVHLHSTFSDGTGTVPEIMRAAKRAGADVVLLTDHNTLEARDRGFEGWHDGVLLLVGEEVTPRRENHYLAFDVDEVVRWGDGSPGQICRAVTAAGGFGFAAHPWSKGSPLFERAGPMPWRDIDCEGLAGVEVWSFVNDAGQTIASFRDALRFIAFPERFLTDPPDENIRDWDRLNASGRRVVGIGGIDAHQVGKRVFGRWVVRPMGYHRSFRLLRTHVLCEEPPTGEVDHDRDQVYSALRDGRCYIAADAHSPALGFAFWREGGTLRARTPRPAELRVVRNGAAVGTIDGDQVAYEMTEPGSYRVEAHLRVGGRRRTWILSNPL